METLWQDIRHGFRLLFRNPGYSLLIVLLVAVGVGGSTAVFSIVNAFLIRPLPYREPDQIVFLCQRTTQGEATGVSYLNYLDWRREAQSFEELGCYAFNSVPADVPGGDLPEMCTAGFVSAGFFRVLGVTPRLGRLLSEQDDVSSPTPVTMISHGFWQRHFAADPNVIGKSIRMAGYAVTVVGVMPPGFRYPAYGHEVVDFWFPVGIIADQLQDRASSPNMFALGRLKRGTGLAQARAEMDAISVHLAAQYPSANGNMRAEVESLSTQTVQGKQRAFAFMLAAVVFVFLVTCVNVAGLLFARGVTREREMAVRSALGGARLALVRQMIVENALPAAIGGLIGVLAAAGAIRLLAQTDMIASMRLPEGFFRLDGRVVGFALAITVLSVALFSLLPCLLNSRIAPARVLGSEGRSVFGSRGRHVVHASLIGTEVALTVVLLVAAGLMVRSFVNVVTADPGFDARNALTARVALGGDLEKCRELLDRTRTIPGVEKVALSFPLFAGWKWYACAEGAPVAPADQLPVLYKVVSPGYFETMGIRLLQGRTFNEEDRAGSKLVVVVDETLARHYWPQADAIGRRIQHGKSPDPNEPWFEIVGVVAHVKNDGIEGGSAMEVYRPLFQRPSSTPTLIVRTEGDPGRFAAAVKDIVRQIEPRFPLMDVQTLEQIQSRYTVTRRMITFFLAIFAGAALFLSTVGIYAVTRYVVSRRTQEFGIRVALGADAADILRLVLGGALSPVLIGAAAGLAGTIVVARVLSSLLFRLSPWDPLTYGAAALLLISVALLASYLPARRAARIDPMAARRYE